MAATIRNATTDPSGLTGLIFKNQREKAALCGRISPVCLAGFRSLKGRKAIIAKWQISKKLLEERPI